MAEYIQTTVAKVQKPLNQKDVSFT